MAEMLGALGAWALPALWVPLAAWTVVWLAAEAAGAALRGAHPMLRYRLAQAALLALPVGVLLAALVEVPAFHTAPALAPAGFEAELLPFWFDAGEAGPVAPPARPLPWAALLGGLTLGAAALALLRGARLATHAAAFRRLRRRVLTGAPAEVAEVPGPLGLRQRVRVVETAACPVPIAFGALRPVVALPAGLAGEARALALRHELAHVRHGDFAAQWAEALTAAAFAVHPGVHRLRQRCTLLREMVCDATLLASPGVSRRAYAALVLSYVVPPAPAHPAAVGMADSRPHLQHRLHAMTAPLPPRPSRPLAWALALVVLLGGALTLTAAQGFVAEPAAPLAEPAPAPAAADTTAFMIVEEMPELIGGLEGFQARLRYPELARRAGIEGTVFITFVVDEEGGVMDAEVVRGIGGGTDEAALEAVREARFVPGRHRGEPVRVRMALPVRFRLDEGERSQAPPASGTATAPGGFHARMVGLPRPIGRDGRTEAIEFGGVVYHDEAPVAGARVYPEADPQNVVTTGADGAFALRIPTPVRAREDGGTGTRFVITHPVHGTASAVWGGSERAPAPRAQPDEQAPEFSVRGAYPNPSTGEVRIEIALPAAAEVTVTLFDAAGRRVREGASQRLAAGDRQTLVVDGAGLAAGVYAYAVRAVAERQTYTASGTFTVAR